MLVIFGFIVVVDDNLPESCLFDLVFLRGLIGCILAHASKAG